MTLAGLHVAVVGGGIGGMAAAAALAARGADVSLYERASAFGEVGAGLQVSANGQRVLSALRVVGPQAPEAATVSPGTAICDGWSGRQVGFVPAPRAGPTWYMHRADLLALLTARASELGVGFHMLRSVGPGQVDADIIVAADGARSSWRATVDGPDEATFAGHVAWRALVPWEGPVEAPARLAMGAGAHIVAYPLRRGRFLNLVAIEDRSDWHLEGWSIAGDPAAFRTRFAPFGGPLNAAIARVETVHQWALHTRPVARRWFKDRTVLLGDAAHPTLPFMAQGACLALEDAYVLAGMLARHRSDLRAAFAAYQEARATRAARVVGLARGNAWRFHMPRPFAWGAQAALALGGGLLSRRLEWVYDYDASHAVQEIGSPS